MKKKIFTLLLIVASFGLFAQQDEMYTQFFANKLGINPAYAGSREAVSMLALYRNQWVGFEGSPKNIAFTIHTPIFNNTSGIGLGVVTDRIGIFNNLIVNAVYTYRIKFPFGNLSLGFNARLKRIQVDWDKTSPLEFADNSIPYKNNNAFLPNFGAGAYFYNEYFFAGISVPHFLENKIEFTGSDADVFTDASTIRHYFAMLGGIYEVNNSIKLQPSAMVKYVKNSPIGFDINLSLILQDRFLVGGSMRTKESFSVVLQVFLNNRLSIGYSHDFGYNKLASYHSGTHEIFVAYDIPFSNYGVDNPRYF